MAKKKIGYAEFFSLCIYVHHTHVDQLSKALTDASFSHKTKDCGNSDVEFMVEVWPPNATEAYTIN